MTLDLREAVVLVDGPNLYHQEFHSGTRFGYHGVRKWARECGYDVVRAAYFTRPTPTTGHVNIRPLLDFLSRQGWSVIRCNEVASFILDEAREAAENYRDVILISGSAPEAVAAAAVKRHGRKFVVASTLDHLRPELRDAADEVIDLRNTGLLEPFERTPRRSA